LRHQHGKIIRNGALRLLPMIISNRRLARPSVPTHVRADNREARSCQAWGDPMPARCGPGMTMDEKQRRTVATEPYSELHLSDIDHLVGESLEHGHLQPAQPRSAPTSNAHSIVANPSHWE